MPVNRSYGYGGYGTSGYGYTPGMYSSSFATTSYGRAGSSSPATLRANTPARSFGAGSLIQSVVPENCTSYKYLARKDYFSPSAYNRILGPDQGREELRTIKTEELDISADGKETGREHAVPGQITRDTTLNVKGGKAAVRIVTEKVKENPCLTSGWLNRLNNEESNQLTLGQRLALKHQIKQPKVKTPSPPVPPNPDSGEESEWTWETCSSSEAEEIPPPRAKKKTPTPPSRKRIATPPKKNTPMPPQKKPSPPKNKSKTPPLRSPTEFPKRTQLPYTKSKTTNLCSSEEKTTNQTSSRSFLTQNRWLNSPHIEQKKKNDTSPNRIPNFGKAVAINKNLLDNKMDKESEKTPSPPQRSGRCLSTTTTAEKNPGLVVSSPPRFGHRPLSWAGPQDVQTNVHTENKISGAPASSSSSSSSPPLYKYNPRKAGPYTGAGSHLIDDSSDEEDAVCRRGWRPGQPPRGEVVVKLATRTAVINSDHSKQTNRVLTSDQEIRGGSKGQGNTKNSSKAGQPVEAKLTLKPADGTMALTTKVGEKTGYHSSIYTPSKSPILEARMQQRQNLGERQNSATPSVRLAGVVNKVTADKSEASEGSEWEYYTETEPSDTEEQKVGKATEPPDKSDPTGEKSISNFSVKEIQPTTVNNFNDSEFSVTSKDSPNKHEVEIKEIPPTVTNNVTAMENVNDAKDLIKPLSMDVQPNLVKINKHPLHPVPNPKSKQTGKQAQKAIPLPNTESATNSAVKPINSKTSKIASEKKVKPASPPGPLLVTEPKLRPVGEPEVVPELNAKEVGKQRLKSNTATISESVKRSTEKHSTSKTPSLAEEPKVKSMLADDPSLPILLKPESVGVPDAVSEPKLKDISKQSKKSSNTYNSEAGTSPISKHITPKAPILTTEVEVKSNIATEPSLPQEAKLETVGVPERVPQPKSIEIDKKPQKPPPSTNEDSGNKSKAKPTTFKTQKQATEVKIESTSLAETSSNKPKLEAVGVPVAVPELKLHLTPIPKSTGLPSKSSETSTNRLKIALKTDPTCKQKSETSSKRDKEDSCSKPAFLVSSSDTQSVEGQKTQISQSVASPSEMPTQALPITTNVPQPTQTAPTNKAAIVLISQKTSEPSSKSDNPAEKIEVIKTELEPKAKKILKSKKGEQVTGNQTIAVEKNIPSIEKTLESGKTPVKITSVPDPEDSRPPCSPALTMVPPTEMIPTKRQKKHSKSDLIKQEKKKMQKEREAKKEEEDTGEEEDDMGELLRNRPTILRDVDRDQNRRLTPQENMAVIKMYGGVMFQGGNIETTPKRWLFKVRKALQRLSSRDGKRDSLVESQLFGVQNSSSSSTNSSVSSFRGYSRSRSQSAEPPESDDSYEYSESEEEDDRLKDDGTSEAPCKFRPKFRKYGVNDFRFIKVLGKGSFGKVLLAELRPSQNYYAVKALRKDSVLEDDDIECTMIERKVLALGVKHPFLCHLFCTFQTDSHLFFVMEYLNGGDLMFHIQQQGRFDTERARFYSAEIVCALRFLHQKGIVYRDLKLDNLLLDYEGHIRIVDFGMCKLQVYLDKTADTFCGTPDYMAPEIIKGMKYTHSVDWWSFGVLLYEMLIGQSPFNGCDEDELFWSICNEQAYFPRFLSKEAKLILTLLLEKNPVGRLGVSDCIHGDIRRQPFFRPLDFCKVETKQVAPPYRPKLKSQLDVSYFDTAFTEEPTKLTPIDKQFLAELNQAQFKGFSYTSKIYTTK